MSILVVYFSVEAGKTAGVAKELAAEKGAELYEIRPEKPYSRADLNWMNPLARCNREHIAKKDVPVDGKVEDFDQYDTIYIGFPIWYGCAPIVINTFCKAYDWSGKTVHAFATSGGSGIGKSAEKLAPYVKGAVSVDAKCVSSAAELKDFQKQK